MPIAAYHSHNSPPTMNNINSGEMQLGIRPQGVPHHYSRGPHNAPLRAPKEAANCSTESNINSDLAGYKLSIPTDGDWSDGQERRSSGTRADVTNLEPTSLSPKDRDGVGMDSRTEKRKMKRFRLTHSQTRYLMSEFARQSHPDAAHRERLSREIPGLSPRQVQVWFQNRRAKLKRLTSDDRERMLKSRALPDDFDMTLALHSPYTDFPPPATGQFPPPGIYYHDKASVTAGPVFTGVLKPYCDEYTVSPLSPASAWDSYFSHHLAATPKDDMSPPGHMPESSPNEPRPYIASTSYSNPSRPVWTGLPLPFRFGDTHGQTRNASSASSSPSNDPATSASLHHTATPLCNGLPKNNGQSFNGTTSSPNFLDNNKADGIYCEEPGPAQSPRMSCSPLKIPTQLQSKPALKDLKPAVQSASAPVSQKCGLSPSSSNFNPNFPGVSYAPQPGSAVSLPPLPFYLDHQPGRPSDEHRASPTKCFNEHLPSLTNSDGMAFTSGFPFTCSS